MTSMDLQWPYLVADLVFFLLLPVLVRRWVAFGGLVDRLTDADWPASGRQRLVLWPPARLDGAPDPADYPGLAISDAPRIGDLVDRKWTTGSGVEWLR